MHHAQRSIRVSRPGARTAATATKPAPRPLGKWEPQTQANPEPIAFGSIPKPNYSKWGLNSSTSSPPSASSSTPGPSKWARPMDAAPQPQRTDSPFVRDIPKSSGSFKRDPPPTPNAPRYQSVRRDNRSGSSNNFSLRDRGPAPHQNRPAQQPSASSGGASKWGLEDMVSPRRSIFQKPEKPAPSEVEPEPKKIDTKSPQASQLISSSPSLAPRDEVRVRYTNSIVNRTTFKERGSLVAKLNQRYKGKDKDDEFAIPNYSRNRAAPQNPKKVRDKKNKSHGAKHVKADVFIPTVISVANLARLLKVKLDTLQRKMTRAGMAEQSSHDYMLSSDYSSLLAMEFNRNPVVNDEAAFDVHPPPIPADKSSLPHRPPVVTIMGHVDHGKTTLLDTLRSTSVAKGEAGGITQHIGAFSVPVPAISGDEKRTITFLDTPGHAAFSAMRARGASVTDIVVLVVAADDGIMPQTREVIELVQKEKDNVGLVVAVNKVDKPDVDIDRIEKMLLAENVQLERFGGDIPCVHVSGLTGQGLDSLVETINALAEMQDIRAEQKDVVQGYVLESKMQKGLGPVATVLLLRGSLTPGTHLICGTTQAKVRSLTSPSGESIKSVLPGFAAVVSGWKELPNAGDEVLTANEADIKRAIGNRIRKAELEASLGDMEAINVSRKEERDRKEAEEANAKEKKRLFASGLAAEEPQVEEGRKEVRIVVKADVSGSSEAVAQALIGVGNDIAGTKIVATGVGDVTESDIMRAKASGGIVVAFGVKVPRAMESLAAGQNVPIVSSTIIYRLLDSVKEHVIKLLPVKYESKVTGQATVLQIFEITAKNKQTVKVAGCRVNDGTMEKGKQARVIRNDKTIFEGKVEALKHLKDDVSEAAKGTECGINIEGFDDLKQGDIIQLIKEVEKPGEL